MKYIATYIPEVGNLGEINFIFDEIKVKRLLEDAPRDNATYDKRKKAYILSDEGCIDFIENLKNENLYLGKEQKTAKNIYYQIIANPSRVRNEDKKLERIQNICNSNSAKHLEQRINQEYVQSLSN
jgi:hypothetical protein